MHLNKGAHVHLMGICGTAMASLAGLFQDMGMRVTGSDQNVYPPMSLQLEKLKIPVHLGYRAENLTPRPDLVIVGNVISKANPEAEALLRTDIPYTSLPKALGEWVIGERDSLVVAGTHGKTTTTSMLAWVAEVCGLRPGFLIGGIPENFSQSFRMGRENTFVIEGDEYDTAFFDKVPKFIHYKPKHVILTSIEFDHADIYKDLEDVKAAFLRLVELIPEDGTLVYHSDDVNIADVLGRARIKVQKRISYGLNSGQFRAVEKASLHGRQHFCVERNGSKIADVALKMFGDHNILNAMSVFALAESLGWGQSQVLGGLASFLGVQRRQQFLGEAQGVAFIEDFAHHPTAVKLTIGSIRERFPGRRVLAVFEPRSATSRRSVFQQEYVEALRVADLVFVAQAFDQSKIQEQDRFSSQKLVRDLEGLGVEAFFGVSTDKLVDAVRSKAAPGDVVLIMSNGGFDGIYPKLIQAVG